MSPSLSLELDPRYFGSQCMINTKVREREKKITSWKYEGDENNLLEAVNGRCQNVLLEPWQDLKLYLNIEENWIT